MARFFWWPPAFHVGIRAHARSNALRVPLGVFRVQFVLAFLGRAREEFGLVLAYLCDKLWRAGWELLPSGAAGGRGIVQEPGGDADRCTGDDGQIQGVARAGVNLRGAGRGVDDDDRVERPIGYSPESKAATTDPSPLAAVPVSLT